MKYSFYLKIYKTTYRMTKYYSIYKMQQKIAHQTITYQI